MKRMQDLPPVCIIDANVLFDAEAGGFLPDLFCLDCLFLTTDIVAHNEIKSIPHADLLALGLRIQELSGDQILEMIEIRRRYLALSIPDISVMLLARRMGAVLLSGDGPLRKIAEEEGVVLHGTLWILDHLVSREILSRTRAAGAVEAMQQNGCWLPGVECRRRIRAWRWG
ncbi:MAG: DUF3368 domain-containing protein [Methanomicrobiales archaeon]|nr:DUF3368 domain-containing protein [Methanomicrobiales archaeon]